VMILKANAIFSVPQLIAATLLLETGQWQSMVSANAGDWLLLAFVGFVGFYLAYMAWYSVLKTVRVEQAVPFILLMTPVGLISAVLFLGEKLTGLQIIGGAILMLGLAVVNDLHRAIFFLDAQKDAA
jgi:O-acetylserine/cysteine efflux transporter